MKRKVKQYTDEPEEVEMIIGSHSAFTEVPTDDKPVKPQIGFIREPKERKQWKQKSKKLKKQ
jgi:hypothetical protein